MYYSNNSLKSLLDLASKDELRALTAIVKPDSKQTYGPISLVKEISSLGGNSLSNFFRGAGVRYTEILLDISDQLGNKELPPMIEADSKTIGKIGYLNYDKEGQTFIAEEKAISVCALYALETEREITMLLFKQLIESEEGIKKEELLDSLFSCLNQLSEKMNISVPSNITPTTLFGNIFELDRDLRDTFLLSITTDYLKYSAGELDVNNTLLKSTVLFTSATGASAVASTVVGAVSAAASVLVFPVVMLGVAGVHLNLNLNDRLKNLVPAVMMIFRIRTRLRLEKRLSDIKDDIAAPIDTGLLINKMTSSLFNTYEETIRDKIDVWLKQKKKQFTGSEYISQLEKNAVYLNESYKKQYSALVTFLITAYDLDAEYINLHCENGQSLAKDSTALILNYLQGSFDMPSAIFDIDSYAALKELKDLSELRYQDELEFQCNLFRAKNIFVRLLISYYTNNKESLNSLRGMPEEALKEALTPKIDFYCSLLLGDVEMVS